MTDISRLLDETAVRDTIADFADIATRGDFDVRAIQFGPARPRSATAIKGLFLDGGRTALGPAPKAR